MDIKEYEEYKCPKDHIDFNSKAILDKSKKYAYVMLLMLNDNYLPGALTLAYAIKKQNTIADLVIMVTNDISKEAKDNLRLFYTKIVEVDYIIPEKGEVNTNLLKRFPHY